MRLCVFVAITAFSLILTALAGADAGGKKTGQVCYKGAYVGYQDPSTARPFASQGACVSFVANGGTLIPEVDMSVAFDQPGLLNCVGVSCPQGTGDVVVHNGGAVAVTVTLTVDWPAGAAVIAVRRPGCSFFPDTPPQIRCTLFVPAGQTFRPASLESAENGVPIAGSISITGATSPDPVTSNNSVDFTLIR